MRILMINDRLDMAGGAERYTVDVAQGLSEMGHQVRVVYGSPSPAPNFQFSVFNFQTAFIDSLATTKVGRELISFDPQVVYVQNISSPELLEELAEIKPTVRFVHDHRSYCPGNSKMWFSSSKICPIAASWRCAWHAYKDRCMTRHPQRLVERVVERQQMLVVMKTLPKVLCNSTYVRGCLLQNGLAAERLEVNPLFPGRTAGPAAETLQTRRVWSRPFGSAGVPEVLFVGRIFIEKGVDYLLRVVALIKDLPFRVTVVGEGWDLGRCKALAEELGVGEKVEFTGFLPRGDINKYYARCRMLVVPSLWPEPFGIVGLEALANGKPVVAFNVGGISDWLENGKVGFLVERGNIDDLSGRIGQLLKDKSLAQRMGEAGRRLVQEKFTLERHLSQLLKVFQGLSL